MTKTAPKHAQTRLRGGGRVARRVRVPAELRGLSLEPVDVEPGGATVELGPVESKDFTVTWVSGKYNPADIFTKPLAPAAFISHFDFIFENIPYYNELEGGTHAYSGP